MSLNHVLYCNKDQPSLKVLSVTFKNNQFSIYSETQNGTAPSLTQACPLVRISGLSALIADNIYIVALICIIVGIFECLYGKRLLQPTLFVIGYLCGFIFSLLIFRELLRNTDNIFYLWISMMISVLVGAFVGAVAMQLHKIGILVVGIGLGIVLALLFWTAVIAHLTNSVYLFYTLIVLFSLGCSILSWRIFDHVIIFSTSFMGVGGACYIVVPDIPRHKLDFFGVSKRIQLNAANKIGPTPRASEDALRVPGGDPAVRSVRNQVPVP